MVPSVNFVYMVGEDYSIRVEITDTPLRQDGSVLESMGLDGNASISVLLAEAFLRGVNIGRIHPKIHFSTPTQQTPA